MIKLSVSDKFDGLGKIDELRANIGNVFSDNHSGTGYSRLMDISEDGDRAYTVEVCCESSKKAPKKGTKSQPSWLVWNAMCS